MALEILFGRGFCFFCLIVCSYVVIAIIKAEYKIKKKKNALPLLVYVKDYTSNMLKGNDFFLMKNDGDALPEKDCDYVDYLSECCFYL